MVQRVVDWSMVDGEDIKKRELADCNPRVEGGL